MKDRLNKLEQELYSRKRGVNIGGRSEFEKQVPPEAQNWREDQNLADLFKKRGAENKRDSFFKKILITSIVFFVLALLGSLVVFFGGKNSVSSKNIDIEVTGPSAIGGGETLSIDLAVKNSNTVALQDVVLIAEYPSGTKVEGNLTTELSRAREVIGKIEARSQVTKNLKAVLFGEKQEVKNIKFTIEYRIEGSSARFFKDKIYEIGIKSAPVILNLTYSKEVNSNQPFEINIEISSNSAETLRNLLVKAVYPFGFNFQDSGPSPSDGNNTWEIGDLESGKKKVIKLRGILVGQNEEERTFNFSAGLAGTKQENQIETLFTSSAASLKIKRPFIGLSATIDGREIGNFSAVPGQKSKVNIIWSNNLGNNLLDLKIEARLSGEVLDRNSILVTDGGFYRSFDNTIVWDKSTSPDLREVAPGERGVVGFTFAPMANISAVLRNQQIGLNIKINASQLRSGVPEAVFSSISENIKIYSILGFSGRSVRSVGPFENMGPIPPKADQETTYTIILSLSTPLNDIANTTVTGVLPSYVSWKSLVSPTNENVTFDPLNRRITWNPGLIKAGSGTTNTSRQAAFQVGVTPSLSQVGNTINIINDLLASGDDQFTLQTLRASIVSLTTRAVTDPQFKEGDDKVVK